MNRALLRGYYAMPVWVQNLMASAYGVRLQFLRYGRRQSKFLDDLLVSQWYSRERLERLQLDSLNGMLRHAAATVPFYRARHLPDHLNRLEELRGIPLLRKVDLRCHGDELVASGMKRSSVELHTGGTTGTPLNILCDRATLQRNYAFFARLLRWAGVKANARVARLIGRTIVPPGQARPPYWRVNLAANALMMSSYHISPDTVDSYIERLRSFQPELIDSYPSSLEPLARRLAQSGSTAVRPRAIVTSSETLSPQVRQLIETAFGCQVFDHYGAAEMAAFVTQCEYGAYHVNPEFGIVEILRDGEPVGPGESGEIVATGFINPVMPLIRYATGDAAVQGEGRCRCARAFPTLERIEGRMDDVILTPEGRRIGRLDPIFKGESSIHEARIVQDAANHVRLEIVPDVGFTPEQQVTLVQELALRLGPSMRIDVLHVTSLPRAASGKLRMVVREVALQD